MYTTCSLTVTVSSSWLSATVVKPEKPTQKSIVKKKKKFFIVVLFDDSSWITYYGCPIRNIFDNNRTCAYCYPFSYFYSLNNTSSNPDMRSLSYFYITS